MELNNGLIIQYGELLSQGTKTTGTFPIALTSHGSLLGTFKIYNGTPSSVPIHCGASNLTKIEFLKTTTGTGSEIKWICIGY